MDSLNLWDSARACLLATDPDTKVELTRCTADHWCHGRLIDRPDPATADQTGPRDCIGGLPPNLELVRPRRLAKRKAGSGRGHAALIHAIAHIEFNAINLAWDAVYRFRGLPTRYYRDWIQVANEEAYHFVLISEHLASLGFRYGDFPAHDGLWQTARATADDPLQRMALVPRVLEARGLDVTPGMIERVRDAGDSRAAAILRIILADEIGHVATGSRWFKFLCNSRGLEPAATYRSLYQASFGQQRGKPVNRQARLAAGFSVAELDFLEGSEPEPESA